MYCQAVKKRPISSIYQLGRFELVCYYIADSEYCTLILCVPEFNGVALTSTVLEPSWLNDMSTMSPAAELVTAYVEP